MSFQKHFLNSNRVFDKFKAQIEKEIDSAFAKIEKLLPLGNVDVVIRNSPFDVIPEIGIGAYTPDAHTIYLYFDMTFPKIKHTIETEVVATLAHESHHCMRWRGPGYGMRLFEGLVSEGLADHFEMEVTGNKVSRWAKSFSKDKLKKIEKRAQKEFWSRYNHLDWFFGSADGKIPRFAGYSLGYDIVDRYMKKTSKKASELYNVSAKDIYDIVYKK